MESRRYEIASPRETLIAFALAGALGLFLAAGLLPTSAEVGNWLTTLLHLQAGWLPAHSETIVFPALALAFYRSLPPPPQVPAEGKLLAWSRWSMKELLAMSLLPLLISFLVGQLDGQPALRETPAATAVALWLWLLAPIGEEALFRGWIPSIVERFFPLRALARTHPLPLWLWASSLAFSLWHLQNGFSAWAIWQVVYTFGVGIWLGWVRWHSGGIALPIVLHALMNILFNL